MRPGHRLIAVLLAAATVSACETDEPGPSSLAKRAQAEEPQATAPTEQPQTPSPEGGTPPPPSERVELKLALDDPTHYRVQVFGRLQLPLVMSTVGFVTEERIDIENCTGTEFERKCQLSHRYSNFEAQPGGGKFVQANHDKVRDFRTTHPIGAGGLKAGASIIEGQGDAEIEVGLANVHRLFCLRFPSEPVGKGAKWSDTCTSYNRGQIAIREVVWELSEITNDPEDGRRAELIMVGKYREPATGTEGTINGQLFFYVDHGQPKTMTERIAVTLDAEKGLQSKTDLMYVFGKSLPDKPNEFVQTNGKPFDGKALSGAPLGTDAADKPGGKRSNEPKGKGSNLQDVPVDTPDAKG